MDGGSDSWGGGPFALIGARLGQREETHKASTDLSAHQRQYGGCAVDMTN